jgi:hypothetical protein
VRTPEERLLAAEAKTIEAARVCEALWVSAREARLAMNRARGAWRSCLREDPVRARAIHLPALRIRMAACREARQRSCMEEELQLVERLIQPQGVKGGECPPIRRAPARTTACGGQAAAL